MGMVWAYSAAFCRRYYCERMKNMTDEEFLLRKIKDVKENTICAIGMLLLVLLPIGLSIVMQLMILKLILA